jgi:predicted DNA-binding antitoxin AbrB/MazE fold protein
MSTSFDAVYEDGVLKPVVPLPLQEHERVRVTLEPKPSLARESAGMLPWTDDAETLRRLAEDPEFGISGSP